MILSNTKLALNLVNGTGPLLGRPDLKGFDLIVSTSGMRGRASNPTKPRAAPSAGSRAPSRSDATFRTRANVGFHCVAGATMQDFRYMHVAAEGGAQR